MFFFSLIHYYQVLINYLINTFIAIWQIEIKLRSFSE